MEVVDIGANIGYYTLIEASNVGDKGQVTAIEPTPSSFRRLEKNCMLNGFENVELLNIAVGSDQSRVSLKEKRTHNHNKIHEKGEISVEQDSLDSLIDFDPDIVRMDVEGYELEILKGMEKTLDSEGLILFLEVHPSKIERNYGGNKEEFWRILSENGFRVKYLIRHPPRPKPLYFLKWGYPPKRVLQPDMCVEEARKEHSDFFAWESVFRVFLKKQ